MCRRLGGSGTYSTMVPQERSEEEFLRMTARVCLSVSWSACQQNRHRGNWTTRAYR
ncbi:hypothetical protein B0H10DRAFT_2044499 [Mycena sp. CBHHK59/15]|nr:hypothetical protein B0H10DRAFT_2044499 [Mycena sp. CBHHK59/15]